MIVSFKFLRHLLGNMRQFLSSSELLPHLVEQILEIPETKIRENFTSKNVKSILIVIN